MCVCVHRWKSDIETTNSVVNANIQAKNFAKFLLHKVDKLCSLSALVNCLFYIDMPVVVVDVVVVGFLQYL